ncbi:MAG: tRNA 5-methoxyuridine(34)/uridine 5-oxyacetic acid(34) synthase CmoB [Verrucomicrobia bacterium]|nr:tRNA 5-methoxyuridine(34)/uridine 5-oxyacetic acid(34) synthase CmoB [Verrucomicrobiota bacterium]
MLQLHVHARRKMKIDYSDFFQTLESTPLEKWIKLLPERIAHGLRYERHGLLPEWEEMLAKLPSLETATIELKDEVRVDGDADPGLEALLKQFHPWRKGPYHIHGVHIDTEWRSDWKWDRVRPHLQPLEGRTILDVGCGNGYHCWRMLGEGAKLVVGIDPSPLFICQFFAMKHFIQNPWAWVLPLGIEEVPDAPEAFDTVFSMGVLYHRKSPMEHIERLKSFLRPGGEMVIETLVVDGPEGYSLTPNGRYAKMRNVWFIPTPETLEYWMHRCGLKNIRTVDITTTSTDEQRSTNWMTFESLPTFLDPADPTKTVEGHPAPNRAVVVATA